MLLGNTEKNTLVLLNQPTAEESWDMFLQKINE